MINSFTICASLLHDALSLSHLFPRCTMLILLRIGVVCFKKPCRISNIRHLLMRVYTISMQTWRTSCSSSKRLQPLGVFEVKCLKAMSNLLSRATT
ncbi:hypothetical protein ACJIZ3_008513 [Penstemon smallii]|uniref:Secreted protein n=1 Tax=Penstemon smallii TaxID=265156 RepID=A0ABD3T9Y7_9LAMI